MEQFGAPRVELCVFTLYNLRLETFRLAYFLIAVCCSRLKYSVIMENIIRIIAQQGNEKKGNIYLCIYKGIQIQGRYVVQ